MIHTALIFAGGTGTRMNNKGKPKQFLELHGKPIIIHTIEHFERHPGIHSIAVVCIAEWIEYLREKLEQFQLQKVRWLIPGGTTSQESTRNGLYTIARDQDPNDTIVLIHDGVRPLINAQTISDNIDSVLCHGSAITVAPAIETIITTEDGDHAKEAIPRHICRLARAPQSFILANILDLHRQAEAEGHNEIIDSASLMLHYGKTLKLVQGPVENIKITTPSDFYIFRAIMEARENMQILGV